MDVSYTFKSGVCGKQQWLVYQRWRVENPSREFGGWKTQEANKKIHTAGLNFKHLSFFNNWQTVSMCLFFILDQVATAVSC